MDTAFFVFLRFIKDKIAIVQTSLDEAREEGSMLFKSYFDFIRKIDFIPVKRRKHVTIGNTTC